MSKLMRIITALCAVLICSVSSFVNPSAASATVSKSCYTTSTWYTQDWLTVSKTYVGNNVYQYYTNRSVNREVSVNSAVDTQYVQHKFSHLEASYVSRYTVVTDNYYPGKTATYRYRNAAVRFKLVFNVYIAGRTLVTTCTVAV